MMPIKKAMLENKRPISSIAFFNNSTNDTMIITPAEKPKIKLSNDLEGFLIKNSRMLPKVVERPAKKESNKAVIKMSIKS